jgi:hypothetical protein
MSSPERTPSRREFLKATAAGAAGLVVAAPELRGTDVPRLAKARSCIFINLVGGPSHLDTFDPKPDAPADVRGPFRPIPTRVPGVYLSELFPKLAGMADKFSLVRSMHHDAPPIHETGFQLLNTGRLFRDGPEWPSMGCVWTHLHGETGTGAGRRHYVTPWPDVDTGIQIGKGFGPGFLRGHVAAQECGARAATVDPRYGTTEFGQLCHGVVNSASRRPGRFLTVNMFTTVFDAPSWDCHADRGSLATDLNDYREIVAPMFDTAFCALLTDLDNRGLLDSTLVVATGEFGRTPLLNANGGRDHWANCWTAIVAGGGVKGGRIVGSSDRLGGEPKDRPVTPQELVATIFHALGVPPDATIPGPAGEPVAVYPGRPVLDLF